MDYVLANGCGQSLTQMPSFSGWEFSKYLGFKHEQKIPRNPQDNAEAEQLTKGD